MLRPYSSTVIIAVNTFASRTELYYWIRGYVCNYRIKRRNIGIGISESRVLLVNKKRGNSTKTRFRYGSGDIIRK